MNILDSDKFVEILLHNSRRAYHSPSLNFKLALDIPASDNQGIFASHPSQAHPKNLNEVNVSTRRRCESQHCWNTKEIR